MAIKITIQSGEGLFKFKDSSINFFESRPKIYQLERYGALKEDQAKIPVIARNVDELKARFPFADESKFYDVAMFEQDDVHLIGYDKE